MKYRMHWHIALTHFPISAFLGAFLFMSLHLITGDGCHAQSAYISLLVGSLVMLPATATGWVAWKRKYKGFAGAPFQNKIRASFAMIVLSIGLVIYQNANPFGLLDPSHRLGHLLYFVGVLALTAGATAEGIWGARLHHR